MAEKKTESPWMGRIQAREKFLKDHWYKNAEEALDLYEMSRDSQIAGNATPFNILYANTEVLAPALYSSKPVPEVISRKTKGSDIYTRAVTEFLTSVTDLNRPDIESLDDCITANVLSALVAGGAYTRIRVDPESGVPLWFESGTYSDIIWAEGKKWTKLPWIAFRHYMTKDEIVKKFSVPADKIQIESQEELDEKTSDTNAKDSCCVYELWDKTELKVIFLCEYYEGNVLKSYDDPLKIAGFYPTPGLLQMVTRVRSLVPQTLYHYYKSQATELNIVTSRLTRILRCIKVRGLYDSNMGPEIESLFKESDGDTDNLLKSSTMPLDPNSSFEKRIWLLPIDKLIIVAKELYTAREEIKQVIFEITGLADIIRGASQASESATAQSLKEKWGSVRLKRMQRTVQNYIRDLYRLTVDIAVEFPPEVWARMAQVELYVTEEEKAQSQQAAEQEQMLAQQPPQPGMPPPPQRPPDPRLEQPSWEALLNTLRDDVGRVYLIDVESDSTLDESAMANQQQVSAYVTALGQLGPTLAPLVQLGPSGFGVAKELLLAVTKKFKFGREVQESIQMLQSPPPQQPGEDPTIKAKQEVEMEKLKGEKERNQMEHELALTKLQDQRESNSQKKQLNQAKFEQQLQQMQIGINPVAGGPPLA